jgi:hypothetical protein
MLTIESNRHNHQSLKTKESFLSRRFMILVLSQFIVLVALLAGSPLARANEVYLAQNAAGAGTGAGCADALPYSFFNSSANWTSSSASGAKIGPGTRVHVCGTITGSPGVTLFTFQGNGTSTSPVILFFEAGAVVQSAYCSSSGGCVNANGKSYVVIDGGGTGSVSLGTFVAGGTIQNTANGEGLANRQTSQLIQANGCNNCTIKNIILANDFVTLKNTPNPLGGAATQMNAIAFNGSNWNISNNVIHDCGWCLYDVYSNGDTNIQVFDNEIYNWDHAFMFATSGANSATGFYFYNNKVHDNAVWENTISGGSSSDCPYHLDGIHFFGSSGSSMDQIYVYDNWWYGALSGPCSSGFLFSETGATPANIKNMTIWNNLFDATGSTHSGVAGCPGPCGNQNGWLGLFSGSVSLNIYSNTMLYNNTNDGTECFKAGGTAGVGDLNFENNVINGCNVAINLLPGTGTGTVDYNFYGDACFASSNCLVWNNHFEGSFAAWKSALSGAGVTGADSHSLMSSYSAARLNSDGSPKAGSPVIQHGANLGSLAAGALASMANDTSKGGSRTTNARPAAGTCSTMGNLPCWDLGAYNYASASSGTQIAPPSGLIATVN